MSRKSKHEEHVNHEAWAIPYGDLITLLLAFFVVMYALSSVNEGKYRVLSDSLIAAFRSSPKSLDPIQVGQLSRAFGDVDMQQQRTLAPLEIDALRGRGTFDPSTSVPETGPGWALVRWAGLTPEEIEHAEQLIEDLSAAVAEELAELVDEDLVRIRRNRFWLEVEINTSVLFATASASLSADAEAIVRRLGALLADTGTRIQVEGHTDKLPIRTAVFPSNWELSSARAASVVRTLARAGVEPGAMAAVGLGEFQPIAPNDTPEGRTSNRRVLIVVVAGGAPRTEVDAERFSNVTSVSE